MIYLMKFLSQLGVSLVQGLVVSSVLAGTALVATRLIQDQKKMMKGVETRDQIEQLHRLIYSALQNREHCDGTFLSATSGGPNITSATMGQTNAINAIRMKVSQSGTFQAAYQVNTGATMDPSRIYMNGNVTIQSMTLKFPSATDPAPTNVMTYPAKLRIEYSRLEGKNANLRTKSGFGGKRIMKEIAIIMQIGTPAAGVYPVDGCYAVQLGSSNNGQTLEGNNNLNQEFCSNLGDGGSLYTWDSLQNKCVLKNNVCPPKYVFTGIKADGNAECKPMSYFLPYMVNTDGLSTCNTASGATVSLTTDASGKVQITCVAAAPSTCSADTVSWTQGADTCSASVASGSGSIPVTDSTAPTTGSATATCSGGVWTASGTCTASAVTCGSVGISMWSIGAYDCRHMGSKPSGTDGEVYNYTVSPAHYSWSNPGSATFTCTGGVWIRSGETCTCLPSGTSYGSGCSSTPGSSDRCCSGAYAVDAGYNCSPPNETQRYYNWYCN